MRAKIINLILIYLLLIPVFVYAQKRECLTEVPSGVTIQQAKSQNLNLYRTNNLYLIRLALHVVTKSNGFTDLTQERLNTQLNILRDLFEQTNFRFYVYSIDTIRSDIYYDVNDMEEANQLRMINKVDGCVNIYFVGSLVFGKGLSSFSPRMDNGPQGIIVQNTAKETLAHEMGHYFDLLHPEHIWIYRDPFNQFADTLYENIDRTGGCANCYDAGDLLCDTPADPSLRMKEASSNWGHVNCQWINDITKVPPDRCGRKDYNPLTDNIMSISPLPMCRASFTDQQKLRMIETLLLYRPELLKHLVYIENRFENENAGGTLSINGVNYPSGSIVALSPGTYEFKTNNERFSDYNNRGFTIKHNNWNDKRADFYLRKTARVDSSIQQIANFKRLDYAKIEVKLEGKNFPDKGVLEFQDPWYVLSNGSQPGNYWITSEGYYEPTGKEGAQEKGVFLNQGWLTWQPPYYSVRAEQVQWIYLPHTGRVYPFYFQGWSVNYADRAEIKNPKDTLTPVVFKKDTAIVSANYKGSMLSNSTKALASTSQRKVVRTPNGHLHIVYESMGKLWYQKSVSNGSTWYAPKLISYPYPELISKNPFLTFYGNTLYLVFESFNVNEGGGVIDLYSIDQNGNITNLFPYQMISIEIESHPSVAVDEENIIIVFKETSSEPLKLIRGFYKNGQWNFSNVINVRNSTDLSFNPVIISGNSSPYNTAAPNRKYFHLVWEEIEEPTRSELCYLTIEAISTNPNDISFSNFDIISRNSGYERNTMQNVVIVYDPSSFKDVLYVGWVGQRKFYLWNANDLVPDESRAVLWISSNRGIFNSYGDDVQSVSLNKCNTRWTFAWARANNLPIQYVDSRDLSRVHNLVNLNGVDVHISNGVIPEDMFAFTINTSASPYPINYRSIYDNFLPIDLAVTEDSREGVVNKDGGVVYYSFGDIKAGDTKVEMKEIPEGAEILTLEDASRYLYSKPFSVNDNTTFVYSIVYGVNDTTALKEALTSTDYIKFRVELIDANTRELLGVLDEVTYNSENVSKYENISYEVNCNGLGERLVQLRLVIQNNVDPYYAISDKYSDAVYNMQKKKAFKSMDYRGLLSNKVYTYSLYQNYPNPFNPVTKIRFSIKETNPVKIKLYDIVGREVAVIMNEVKDAGEYEIELDAGKLGISSGVYFYQMKAGDYTSIKKMVYLK